MASYLLYLPGQTNNAEATLYMARVGLGSLSADCGPSFTNVHQGPDGKGGMVCWWDNPAKPETMPTPGYAPSNQSWEPCKPSGELEAGRYWMGRENDRPPQPRDLERKRMLDGLSLKLADGNAWEVPIAKRVPVKFGLDNEGRMAVYPKQQFQTFYDSARAAREKWIMEKGATVDYLEGARFCVDSLAMNYRLTWDIAMWLGLLGDMEMLAIIAAVCIGERM